MKGHLNDVMVSMLPSKEEICQFNPKSNQARKYTTSIYRSYAKHVALRNKTTVWICLSLAPYLPMKIELLLGYSINILLVVLSWFSTH